MQGISAVNKNSLLEAMARVAIKVKSINNDLLCWFFVSFMASTNIINVLSMFPP